MQNYNYLDDTILIQIPQGDRLEIKIEEGQCSFYLNQTVIEQIQQAKINGFSLEISSKLIIYLWYYSISRSSEVLVRGAKLCAPTNFCTSFDWEPLCTFFSKHLILKNKNLFIILDILNFFVSKTAREKTNLQSGINFNSYYKQAKSASDTYEDEDIILQTTIIFDGDIFHKIKYSFLQNSNLSKIVSVHYWLTEQLISNFQTNPNLLTWELASSFTAGFVVYDLNPANGMLSIFTWLGLTILFAITRYVLVNQLQRLTYMNLKFINWFAWGLVCLIFSVVVGSINDFSGVNFLLLPFLSVMTPKLVEYILSFIQPQVSKLIWRWFLYS